MCGRGGCALTIAAFLLSWLSQKTEMDLLDVSSLCEGNLSGLTAFTSKSCWFGLVWWWWFIYTLYVSSTDAPVFMYEYPSCIAHSRQKIYREKIKEGLVKDH